METKYGAIFQYPILAMNPKIFLKENLAPMYTNFEWESAPQFFLNQIFQKKLKNAFFGLFFKNSACAQKFGPKQSSRELGSFSNPPPTC